MTCFYISIIPALSDNSGAFDSTFERQLESYIYLPGFWPSVFGRAFTAKLLKQGYRCHKLR